jgi:putative FmdB family regulatory protein
MPVYEYSCNNCGEKFEVRRNIEETEKETECPGCGARDTKRVFSLFGRCSSGSSCCTPPPSGSFTCG